jgi:predicted O-methyltransferase YrrM
MTTAAVDRVRAVIHGVFRDGTAVARTDGAVHGLFPVAVPAPEGEALRDLVIAERASETIEIGLGYGVSALFICEGLLTNDAHDPKHLVIDPHQTDRFGEIGLDLLDRAGLANLVEHHSVPSEVALPTLLAEGRRFDLAFLDGNHRFDWVFLDLVFLGRLLRPGAAVFLDDYQLPAVQRAASFFEKNLDWRIGSVSEEDDLHRWVVLRTRDAPDERPYDYFVDF